MAKKSHAARGILGMLFIWYFMLSKRLIKRYSYILLLLSLPLAAFGLKLISEQESGVLHIAIVLEQPVDETAQHIAENLMENEGAIKFFYAGNEDEGRALLRTEGADAVWILHGNTEERIREYGSDGKKIFSLIEAEESTALRLAREKLFQASYPYISKEIYLDFMEKNLTEEMEGESGSDALHEAVSNAVREAEKYYDEIHIEDELVKFAVLEQGSYAEKGETESYLLSPFRGISAIWLVLCGMAASMYFILDEEAGLFALIPVSERAWISLLYHFGIIFNSAVILLLSLALSGSLREPLRELSALSLFILACTGFCNLLRLTFRSVYALCASIPVILLFFLVLSPIFGDIGLRELQILTPSYHYLSMLSNADFTEGFLAYVFVLLGLNLCVASIIKRMGWKRA